MTAIGWTAIGIILTFSIFLANVIYRTGHLSARVEELERWRIDVRKDLHEVSDRLGEVTETLRHLATLIEERTDRRLSLREHNPPRKDN